VRINFLNKLRLSPIKSEVKFESVQGYDDIKNIINRALDGEENFNLMLLGPPSSSKIVFLMEIMKACKDAEYFDCSNTTSRILDILEQKKPKVILLDELEKMSRPFQNQLLNFLESGHVKVTQMHRNYDFEIKSCKVFATANEGSRLSKPLASRFRKLYLLKYTKEEFVRIAAKVCPKLPYNTAQMIGEEVFKVEGSIRDVISISRLLKKHDGPLEVREILTTLNKYSEVGGRYCKNRVLI
jgi:replication-associated recombination protein RarA